MSIMEIMFPSKCVNCGEFGSYICQECLSFTKYCPLVCPVCRRVSNYGKTHDNCKTEFGPDGAISIWKYDGGIRKAIIHTKYRYAFKVGEFLGELFTKEIAKHRVEFTEAIIIPIPLHRKRLLWRGFNQSEVIIKKCAIDKGFFIDNGLLIRSKQGDPQVKLRHFFRSQNIRGKFTVNEESFRSPNLKNKTIILFDDVWTTGSTLHEATRVLKKAGAQTVWWWSVAR